MSAILFKTDILFLQRILASSGFYKGKLDGKWSAEVDAAEAAFIAEGDRIKTQLGEFDPRTELNISSLIPAAQTKAREFMNAVKGEALTYKIISGTRTYAEQDALYKIGRTVEKERKPVTNSRGGQSNHNFGIAWDVGIFEGGVYYTGDKKKEDQAYVALSALIKAKVQGIAWGGDWKKFIDKPHYQLNVGKSESEIQALLEKGKPYV